jgi:hypothetical protein
MEKKISYKVLDFIEHYNFGIGCVSIQGHLSQPPMEITHFLGNWHKQPSLKTVFSRVVLLILLPLKIDTVLAIVYLKDPLEML